jgi:hypothetical protein
MKKRKRIQLEGLQKHCGVQQYLPDYVRHGKDAESNPKLMGAIKTAYNKLIATRHN